MTRKRCISKALAERRRRTLQLHLAEFTQEEIADKLGVHRSVVCRDLQAFRDSICPGDPPDVQEASTSRWQYSTNWSTPTGSLGRSPNWKKRRGPPSGPQRKAAKRWR